MENNAYHCRCHFFVPAVWCTADGNVFPPRSAGFLRGKRFMLEWIISGFGQVLTLENILISFVGCFFGNLVGVLPGLGPTASVALLFPFMLNFEPLSILICLGAVYYGAMYGGSITAVLLNIPGEVSAVPTAMDGYPLAKQGRAGPNADRSAHFPLSLVVWLRCLFWRFLRLHWQNLHFLLAPSSICLLCYSLFVALAVCQVAQFQKEWLQ